MRYAFLATLVLTSCQTSTLVPESTELPKFTENREPASSNGCKGLLDDYCARLYAPDASGNLMIERKKPIQILQGETPNQLSQVFLKYSQAKIRNKTKLPEDLQANLNKYEYFDKLVEFIQRPPVTKMNIDDRLRSEHLTHELTALWQSAIEQTIIQRMDMKYKGFHQIPDRLTPIEYELEEKRMRRKLISEISKTLWREDANWKKVAEGFTDLKASFLNLFNRLNFPESVLMDWRQKIQTLDLVLPGSLSEISDEECSTTNINAFYYKYLNLITVCAGDFNSEDIILTLAHEMSHALDIDRNTYLAQKNSLLALSSDRIRDSLCKSSKASEFKCEDWENYKSHLPDMVQEVSSYKPQLYEFNKCLKKNSTSKTLMLPDVDRIAEKIIGNRISSLATADVFLRLVKEKLPLKNGKFQKNPNFENPCSYYLWSKNEEPIDDDIYTLVYFAAEYKCSAGSHTEKLKRAIDTARQISTEVVKGAILSEGEFSDRPELVSEGFSSPSYERFADVVSAYVVADYLTRFSNQWDRRSKYLASSSWLCQEPSISSNYPEESKIEKQYSLESHTVGEDRKMELLALPIREQLMCEKDFKFNECELPLKH